MDADTVHRRLAMLAPACLIYAVVVVVMLMIDSTVLGVVLVAATIVVPVAFGVYLAPDAPPARRAALAILAPTAQWLFLFVEFLVVWSRSGGLSAGVLAAATILPGVVLLAGGILELRRARWSFWQGALALWLVAIGFAAGALPAATWLAGLMRVDALAAVVVIFAPPAALGVWLGLLAGSLLVLQPRRESTA